MNVLWEPESSFETEVKKENSQNQMSKVQRRQQFNYSIRVFHVSTGLIVLEESHHLNRFVSVEKHQCFFIRK
jgi:hypothetical protein